MIVPSPQSHDAVCVSLVPGSANRADVSTNVSVLNGSSGPVTLVMSGGTLTVSPDDTDISLPSIVMTTGVQILWRRREGCRLGLEGDAAALGEARRCQRAIRRREDDLYGSSDHIDGDAAAGDDHFSAGVDGEHRIWVAREAAHGDRRRLCFTLVTRSDNHSQSAVRCVGHNECLIAQGGDRTRGVFSVAEVRRAGGWVQIDRIGDAVPVRIGRPLRQRRGAIGPAVEVVCDPAMCGRRAGGTNESRVVVESGGESFICDSPSSKKVWKS